jgi:Protein of unknown function (DUF3572)
VLKTNHKIDFDPGNIALSLLVFMSGVPEELSQFLNASGLAQHDLPELATQPDFQAGLLDYALQNESLLLAFASHAGLHPTTLMKARSQLPGFDMGFCP